MKREELLPTGLMAVMDLGQMIAGRVKDPFTHVIKGFSNPSWPKGETPNYSDFHGARNICDLWERLPGDCVPDEEIFKLAIKEYQGANFEGFPESVKKRKWQDILYRLKRWKPFLEIAQTLGGRADDFDGWGGFPISASRNYGDSFGRQRELASRAAEVWALKARLLFVGRIIEVGESYFREAMEVGDGVWSGMETFNRLCEIPGYRFMNFLETPSVISREVGIVAPGQNNQLHISHALFVWAGQFAGESNQRTADLWERSKSKIVGRPELMATPFTLLNLVARTGQRFCEVYDLGMRLKQIDKMDDKVRKGAINLAEIFRSFLIEDSSTINWRTNNLDLRQGPIIEADGGASQVEYPLGYDTFTRRICEVYGYFNGIAQGQEARKEKSITG